MSGSAAGLFASFFLGSFFSLVTIINPPSAIPLFNALSAPLDERGADRLARDASVYVFAILTVSLFAGGLILASFGISYGALRIAGGIVVALLGHGMLFGRDERGTPEAGAARNPAFFPLALPGISGPGSIAVIIGISTEIREIGGWADTLIALWDGKPDRGPGGTAAVVERARAKTTRDCGGKGWILPLPFAGITRVVQVLAPCGTGTQTNRTEAAETKER